MAARIFSAAPAAAAEGAVKKNPPSSSLRMDLKPLYRRLSAPTDDPEGSLAATTEAWVKERRFTSELGLMDLRLLYRRLSAPTDDPEGSLAAVAAEGAGKKNPPSSSLRMDLKPLYRRLSAPTDDPEGSLAATIEAWVKERRFTSELGLMNLRLLYRRLSAPTDDPEGSLAATMETWVKERRFTSELGLMNIVKELRKYKSSNLALALMDWMETRGMQMSAGKYAVRVDLLAKAKGIDFAASYFSSIPDSEKKLQTYGALLNSYCREGMLDEAIVIYHKMKELNLSSNSWIHNNLMILYLKLGQPDKVQALFQEMKANNIPPDTFTYGLLMRSYGSVKDVASVEKIIPEMVARGVALDWSIYAQLAVVYNSAGLYNKADSALKKLEGIMDRRNRSPFYFLISLYAAAGNLVEVNRVWKSLKASFTATNRSYNVMLSALSKLDDFDALKQCFEEWESTYKSYDVRLVNIMIAAYLRKDMMEEAESLSRKATENGFGSNIRTLELFMDYFLKRREMDLALKFFHVAVSQVKQSQWKPDKEKLSAFVKYFHEVNDVDGAEAFRKGLMKLNCLGGDACESLLLTSVSADKKDPLL